METKQQRHAHKLGRKETFCFVSFSFLVCASLFVLDGGNGEEQATFEIEAFLLLFFFFLGGAKVSCEL